jgi:APA family basic amino acid/polyamine antiporter
MTGPHTPRGLGPFQLFTVLFGTIIGVAWIVAMGMWVREAGPVGAVVAFGAGALVMWLIGLCFAEMMALYPDANGSMAYVFESFGEHAAALVGWFLVLTYAATCAWYFVTVAWLIETAVPWIAGPTVYHTPFGPVRAGHLALGLFATILITAVNLRGVGARAVFQDVFVIVKIAIGAVLFLCALRYGRAENLKPPFTGSSPREVWLGIAAVAVTTPFFFAGFDVLPQAVRDRRAGTPLHRMGSIIGLATLAAFVFYGGAILAAGASLDRATLEQASLPVVEAFRVGCIVPSSPHWSSSPESAACSPAGMPTCCRGRGCCRAWRRPESRCPSSQGTG